MESKKVNAGRFIGGILLLLFTFWRIYDAELSVRTANSIIKEIHKNTSENVRSENEGMLVWINGRISLGEDLTDGYVSGGPAVFFKKKVETYQWYKAENGKYYHVWSEKIYTGPEYDTAHHNSPSRYGTTQIFIAKQFSVGAFYMNGRDITTLNLVSMKNLPDLYGLYKNNGMYYSGNPTSPSLGDVRISYYFLPVGSEVSIIGQQNGNFLLPYNGMMYAQNGKVDANDLVMKHFEQVKGEKMHVSRFFNFLIMYLSVYFIASALPWMTQKSKVYFYAVVSFFAFLLTWFVSLFAEML